MPRFDQTGPSGKGPMTGRVMGPCACCSGTGNGFSRGFGRFGRSYLTKSEEVEELKDEAKSLEADLNAVRERISEIEK